MCKYFMLLLLSVWHTSPGNYEFLYEVLCCLYPENMIQFFKEDITTFHFWYYGSLGVLKISKVIPINAASNITTAPLMHSWVPKKVSKVLKAQKGREGWASTFLGTFPYLRKWKDWVCTASQGPYFIPKGPGLPQGGGLESRNCTELTPLKAMSSMRGEAKRKMTTSHRKWWWVICLHQDTGYANKTNKTKNSVL